MNKNNTYENMLPREEFRRMKIVQYEDIAVSKDMGCPECSGSNGFSYSFDKDIVEPMPIGWCDTNHGFMAVFECPKCHTRFRFHINTTGRYDPDCFYIDFALKVYLYRQHRKQQRKHGKDHKEKSKA